MAKIKKIQKILAIIPARGGSKGIPHKNLAKIGRYTLVEWAIKVGLSCPLVSKIILSTDDTAIARVGEKAGAEVPFLRPKYLARDKSRTIDATLHLLKNINYKPDIVLLLQPTAPLRTAEQISEALEILIRNKKASAIISVVPLSEPHPMKTKVVQDGWLKPFFKKADSQIPRQLFAKVYKLNGAIYAVKTPALLKEKSFLPKKTLAYLMPPETGTNIDAPLDLLVLRSLIKSKTGIILKYLKH